MSFINQFRLIKEQHESLSETYQQLKKQHDEIKVSSEQLTKINNAIKQFQKRITQIEARSPTASRLEEQQPNSTENEQTKQKNLSQILLLVSEMQEQKNEQIEQLPKNAKLLNNAAGEFRETLQQSVEKIDILIDDVGVTKQAV